MPENPLVQLRGAMCFANASTQVLTGSLWLVFLFSGCSCGAGEIPTAARQQLREQEDAVPFLKCSAFPIIFVSKNRYKSKPSQFTVGKKGKTLENDEQGYECAKKQLNGMLKFLLEFLSFARGIKKMCNHVCRLHLKWGKEHNETFC